MSDNAKRRLRTFLRKIDELATDGQNGSADYAQDRLIRIREIVDIALNMKALQP